MTEEQLGKIHFSFFSHLAMEHMHYTTYKAKDVPFDMRICVRVPYSNGHPTSRSTRHYMLNGKVYKKRADFIEDAKDLEYEEQM